MSESVPNMFPAGLLSLVVDHSEYNADSRILDQTSGHTSSCHMSRHQIAQNILPLALHLFIGHSSSPPDYCPSLLHAFIVLQEARCCEGGTNLLPLGPRYGILCWVMKI
jgi:hypothetical protein